MDGVLEKKNWKKRFKSKNYFKFIVSFNYIIEIIYGSIRMERAGTYEKAAGWALFHGKTERAITALNNSRGK